MQSHAPAPVEKPDLNLIYDPDELFKFPCGEVRTYLEHHAKTDPGAIMIVLSFYISHHPIDDLNTFFGREWVLKQINNIDNLVELVTDLKNRPNSAFWIKCPKLFDFIGLDWLRKICESAGLKEVCACFNKSQCHEGFIYLLEFLDGNDHWLRNKIQSGRDLSLILHSLIMRYDSATRNEHTFVALLPSEFMECVKWKWDSFITPILDENWKKKFFDDSTELRGFIDEWVEHDHFSQNTLTLFLSTYLDKKRFLDLAQIVNVLNFSSNDSAESKSEEAVDQKSVTDKTFLLVDVFQPDEWDWLLCRTRTFDQVLADMGEYKDKYFYPALLCALTKVVIHLRTKLLMGGGITIFGHTFNDKKDITANDKKDITADAVLVAADDLMQLIRNHKILDEKTAKMEGSIGEIRDAYYQSLSQRPSQVPGRRLV